MTNLPLTIVLSFAFYIPVVLWADVVKAFELAPDGIITDIFPEQGNEQAFGMDMLILMNFPGNIRKQRIKWSVPALDFLL